MSIATINTAATVKINQAHQHRAAWSAQPDGVVWRTLGFNHGRGWCASRQPRRLSDAGGDGHDPGYYVGSKENSSWEAMRRSFYGFDQAEALFSIEAGPQARTAVAVTVIEAL